MAASLWSGVGVCFPISQPHTSQLDGGFFFLGATGSHEETGRYLAGEDEKDFFSLPSLRRTKEQNFGMFWSHYL